MQSFALRTQNLTKRFESTTVVRDLNLHIRPGEIYGFLGPNGAGKTTTVQMLLGLRQPTAGEVFLFGLPLAGNILSAKQRIGVVAEEPSTGWQMTGWEVVRFFAELHRLRRPQRRMETLFHALDLWQARHAPISSYSRGMRQKLSLIRALVHKPDLLVLDEPVSGLDPHGIRQVRAVVEQHRQEGAAVLISSHILSEIERAADRVGILHQGRLLVEDSIDGIRRRLSQTTTVRLTLTDQPHGLVAALESLPDVERVEAVENQIALHINSRDDRRPQIFQKIVEGGGVVVDMRTDEMSLEEAFVTITHRNVAQLAGAP